jgi:hypothetical protein
MGMGMNRLRLCSRSEKFCHRLVPFLLSLPGKGKILPVGLRLAGKCITQIFFRFTHPFISFVLIRFFKSPMALSQEAWKSGVFSF